MIDYDIRPAEKADLPELIHLFKEHAAYEKADYSPEGKLERLTAAIFEYPERLFCEVVEYNKKLLGYVSYTFDYSTWDAAEFMYMDGLFLCEEARGLGIGKAIMHKIKKIAFDRGCLNIQWQTPDFNLPAIGFYGRLGAIKKNKVRFSLPLNI